LTAVIMVASTAVATGSVLSTSSATTVPATQSIAAHDTPVDRGQPAPGTNAGPPYKFETELIVRGVVPLKNQAMLSKSRHGYLFRAGQQDSHITVTLVDGKLRFVDKGTKSWRKLTDVCSKEKVKKGIAATCPVPGGISKRKPLLIEIWPRLGNDYVDTSSLPATYAVTVLGDKGREEVHFGAGPDFFNGYTGRDRVWGGAGNDWIRPGLGNDLVVGGPGDDDVVAVEGHDTVRGGAGNDRIWAGDGNDRLFGGTGVNFLLCGSGHDKVEAGYQDQVTRDCESVNTRD